MHEPPTYLSTAKFQLRVVEYVNGKKEVHIQCLQPAAEAGGFLAKARPEKWLDVGNYTSEEAALKAINYWRGNYVKREYITPVP
jgi:hypothetical protein